MRLKAFIILTALPFIFLSSSCSIEKRHYSAGYNIEWNLSSLSKNNTNIRTSKIEITNINSKKPVNNNSIEVMPQLKYANRSFAPIAANTNDLLEAISSKENSIKYLDSTINTCDNIILKSGEELSAKVVEITGSEIKYKKCDNLGGPIYIINKASVLLIKYPNGTKDIISPSNSPTSGNFNNYSSKNNTELKSGAFGFLSFFLGIAGYFYASLILGPLAIIFGIIGMINRKLKGLAIVGFIIGIVDVVAVLMFLAVI